MPIQKVKGGWRYGNKGKVFSTRAGAAKQMRAMFANGYREKPKESKTK